MARSIRMEYEGAVYHVTARGNRRKRIFAEDADHERCLEYVEEAARRFRWVITSFVLMVNHFHLAIETADPNLARGMQWRDGKVGHLFGERYKAIHVETAAYMKRLARYVVLNPVRAKIVALPEDFRWSSHRATAGLEPAPEWLCVGALRPYFGKADSWRGNYVEFVQLAIATVDPIWRGLRRNIFLCSEQWLESVKQRIRVSRRKSDIPHDQRAAGRPAMTRIVNTIAAKLGVKVATIRDEHGGRWREIAAWLGVHEGMRRLRVIAQTLRLRSCSRVTQLVRSCERRLRIDAEFRQLVTTLQLALS